MSEGAAPEVAIIGGGIGGMAAAFALHQAGVSVTVFERSAALRESGAVLGIRPRTAAIIEGWGLGDAYEPLVSRFESIQNRDGATGKPLFELRLGDVDVDVVRSHDGIRRTDLLHLFADRLPASAIVFGADCVAVVEGEERVRIEFADGTTHHADAVIGADGLRSSVRKVISPEDRPVYAGVVSYPGYLDADLVADLLPDRIPSAWLRESDKAFFLLMPAHHGKWVGFDAIIPDAHGPDDSWERTITKTALLSKLDGLQADVLELVRRVPQEEFLATGLHDREPLTSFTAGRIALLGDAAHPLIPSEGQGVNLAIQDADTLTGLLTGTAAADVPAALRSYSDTRVPIATQIHTAARERHAQMGPPPGGPGGPPPGGPPPGGAPGGPRPGPPPR